MLFYLGKMIKTLIIPPGLLVVSLIVGLILLKHKPRLAKKILAISITFFSLMCLPIISSLLMTSIETYPALSHQQIQHSTAQAIVVLGGGRQYDAEEYNGDTVSSFTLLRLRYAATLHRKTGIPLLVTGGNPLDDRVSEAVLMATALQQDYAITAKWLEKESRNTAENAKYSAQILNAENISNILLVTQAWHMRRAVRLFENQGLRVTAAPTMFEGFNKNNTTIRGFDFLPSINAFYDSSYALHEIIGQLWYTIRY